MTPKLAAYLRRIGYSGPLDPSVKTLRALHRAHLLAISYENVDVQLGVPLTVDDEAAFEKIVERKRGGWCYEMNGLFAWALRELRFDISLLGAAVGRDQRGDAVAMNHLAILVHLDKPYLADVGFGNGFIAPIPLAEGTHSDGRFDFRLQQIDGDWWRITNRPASGDTFDFQLTPYELHAFEQKNRWLQSADESYFVQEHHLALPFADRHGESAHPGEGPGQGRHFVEMGGEQGPATGFVVQRLDRRPGDGQAVESGGTTADFIEDYQ